MMNTDVNGLQWRINTQPVSTSNEISQLLAYKFFARIFRPELSPKMPALPGCVMCVAWMYPLALHRGACIAGIDPGYSIFVFPSQKNNII